MPSQRGINNKNRRRYRDEQVSSDGSALVRVSIKKLDAAWRAAEEALGYYVGPKGVGSNQPGKYERALARLAAHEDFSPPVVNRVPDGVAFSDGRHRFAAARDVGQASMVIEVPADEATWFQAEFPPSYAGRLGYGWRHAKKK